MPPIAQATASREPRAAPRTGLRTALGLMSGTSMDGIDAALIRSDGRGRIEFGPRQTFAYDLAIRSGLRDALGKTEAPPSLVEALTRAHAVALTPDVDAHDPAARPRDAVHAHHRRAGHRTGRRERPQQRLGRGGRPGAVGRHAASRRDGAETLQPAYAWVKRRPSRASWSRCGVLIFVWP